MSKDGEDCRHLLAGAAALCKRHGAWRRESFNVFTVLRSESDEVNLHSRFLVALLDHRKAPDAPRANLEDFLKKVALWDDFDLTGVTVERERDNIDILVTNAAGQAVVIENKIGAGDQEKQLQRYHGSLKERGFEDIRLLYLTPHGHDPSEDSQGGLDVTCISYAKTLPPWLKRCQVRAYAEPGLRGSIDQYLSLVRELTGIGLPEKYMKELEALCMQGSNPRLIHDLGKALVNAKIHLLSGLCNSIEKTLRERIPELPPAQDLSLCSPDRIRGYVEGWRDHWWFGQGYPLGNNGALLAFVMHSKEMDYGVRCDKEQEGYDEVKKILQKDCKTPPGTYDDDQWPWYVKVHESVLPKDFSQDKLRDLEWENIEFLLCEEKRQKLADKIAQDLARVWQIWKDAHKRAPSPA